MAWAQVRSGGAVFLHRVAGLAVDGSRRLLHRAAGDEFWALPGGRVHIGETAAEALRREMAEEIQVAVEVGPMIFVVENYFMDRPIDAPEGDDVESMVHHEVGLYHLMTLPERFVETDSFSGVELPGTPDEFELEFRWFEVDVIEGMDIRPAVLRSYLARPLTGNVTALVQRG
jgi:ADP-ribose pyrophosphatase YjhB (NUDIX family)